MATRSATSPPTDDGTVYACVNRTGQRKPYRFDPARDGGLRSHDRGPRGEKARAALAWKSDGVAMFDVVDSDRRGPDPGHGVSDADRHLIIQQMANRPKHRTVPGLARDIADQLGWSERTVLDVWRARGPYLAGLVRHAFTRRCARLWTDPGSIDDAIDDVATDLNIPRDGIAKAIHKHWPPARDRHRDQ